MLDILKHAVYMHTVNKVSRCESKPSTWRPREVTTWIVGVDMAHEARIHKYGEVSALDCKRNNVERKDISLYAIQVSHSTVTFLTNGYTELYNIFNV